MNGIPSCANDAFLNGVMREKWGFDGLVVSDCGAIDHIHSQFSNTPGMQPGFPTNSSDMTMKRAIEGGCDADCPGGGPPVTYFKGLANAVRHGALSEDSLDRSLVRLWSGAISLGLLDNPDDSPYASLDSKALDTPDTRKLNLASAIQSMVLLKNVPVPASQRLVSHGRRMFPATQAPLLPIQATETVAILGPHFNSTQDLLSDYSPGHWWVRSPLMAAHQLLGKRLIGGSQGCNIEGNDTSNIPAAVSLASAADVAVVLVGLTPNNDKSNSGTPPVIAESSGLETEGHDRVRIDLQGVQMELVQKVLAANPRTVVVLVHGGALDISWCKENVPAILDAHYPGQLGGDAILRTLLNYDGAAPAGRLTTCAALDTLFRSPTDY